MDRCSQFIVSNCAFCAQEKLNENEIKTTEAKQNTTKPKAQTSNGRKKTINVVNVTLYTESVPERRKTLKTSLAITSNVQSH